MVKQSVSKLPPIYATLVTIALIFFSWQKPNISVCEANTNIHSQLQQQHNTRADYERLKIGTTQVEVESILGRGIETKQSQNTNTLIWQNPDGSSIEAVFEYNRLISKSQENLK